MRRVCRCENCRLTRNMLIPPKGFGTRCPLCRKKMTVLFEEPRDD